MSVLLLFAVTAFGAVAARRGQFLDDSFSVSDTRAMKGFFALFVILHHLCTYISDAFPSLKLFEHAGFLAVGGFFLISGYGLRYSATHREDYLKGFFKKRLLPIAVPYYIINLFYIALRYVFGALTKDYVILSLFGVHLWYVTAICVLYVGFYLSHRIFGKRGGRIAATVFTVLYAVVCLLWNRLGGNAILGFWWYNSVICFVIGIWYCDGRDKLHGILKKFYYPLLALLLAVLFFTYVLAAKAENKSSLWVLLLQVICAGAFSVTVIALQMKLRIGNAFLYLCGDMSLELYLTHAIMISFFRSGINIGPFTVHLASGDLYFTAILLGTWAMSLSVHLLTKAILRKNKKKSPALKGEQG